MKFNLVGGFNSGEVSVALVAIDELAVRVEGAC
jgi:hypothetical protein